MPILSGTMASALGVPGAPTIGTATISITTATVPFTAPASNGGAAITVYTATSSPGGLTGTLSQAGSGSITVSGLTGSTSYTFTVTATNAFGASPASAPSNSITAVSVPGAPTIGTATQTGQTSATVIFTAPASNGGSTITSYTATSSPSGFTGTLSQAGSGTITVTGLSDSTAYTFVVRATNAAGTSAASASSNSITTASPPGAAINQYKFYSTYNGGGRSANYVVEWSDNNSNWTQAWSGLASNNGGQCGLLTAGGGGGSYGTHRYWRMRDTGGVEGHFPRVSRHVLTRSNGTDTTIVTYTSDNCSDGGSCCGGYVVGWDFVNNTAV